jgi:hypothetical protein
VIRGAYREPLSLAVGLATATRDRAASSAAGTTGTSSLAQVDLNVAVASANDLIVDNNYGRMDLGLDVRLVGTAAQPSIVGRATIRDGGTLFLGGRSYLIERGVIDFANPRAIVPELDLLARTRMRGPDEAARASSDISLERPAPETWRRRSHPTPRAIRPTSCRCSPRASWRPGRHQCRRRATITLLSGEALFAARAIGGLDSSNATRRSTPLRATRRLRPSQPGPAFDRVEAHHRRGGHAVAEPATRAASPGSSPLPIRAIELRTLARDDRSRSYEMRHDLSFASRRPPRRAAGRDGSRVAAVWWSATCAIRRGGRGRAALRRRPIRLLPLAGGSCRLRLLSGQAPPGVRSRATRRSVRRGRRRGLDDIQAGPVAHLRSQASMPGTSSRSWRASGATRSSRWLCWPSAGGRAAPLAEDGYLRAEIEPSQLPSDDRDKRVRIAITPAPRVLGAWSCPEPAPVDPDLREAVRLGRRPGWRP